MLVARHFVWVEAPLIRKQSGLRVRAVLRALDHQPERADAVAVLESHGVSVAKVRRSYAPALRYDPSRMLETIAALKAIEVDFVKALNRWPGLWGVAPTAWAERLAVLRELNFEVAKLVAAYPSVLSLPPDTIREKTEALSRMGLNAGKVLRHCPSAFGYRTDRIRRTITFLDAVGLDSLKTINAFPPLLCYSVDAKLRPKFHFVVFTMGRSVAELSHRPACFSYNLTDRLIPRYEFAVLHRKQHLSLSTLFATSDERFVKMIGNQSLAAYLEFRAQQMRQCSVPML